VLLLHSSVVGCSVLYQITFAPSCYSRRQQWQLARCAWLGAAGPAASARQQTSTSPTAQHVLGSACIRNLPVTPVASYFHHLHGMHVLLSTENNVRHQCRVQLNCCTGPVTTYLTNLHMCGNPCSASHELANIQPKACSLQHMQYTVDCCVMCGCLQYNM